MRIPAPTSPPSRLRITIIGCGTLGQALAHGVVKQRPGNVRLDEIVLTGRRGSHVDALQLIGATLDQALEHLADGQELRAEPLSGFRLD